MSRWTKLVETDYQGMHVYVAFESFRPLYDSDLELNEMIRKKPLWTRLVIVEWRVSHVNSWANLEELLRAQLQPFDNGRSLFYIGETPSGLLRILPSPGPYLGAMALPPSFVGEIRNRGGNLDVNLPARPSP